MKDALESQDFYELMQAYRHCPLTHPQQTAEAFEAVKAFVLAAAPAPAVPEVMAGPMPPMSEADEKRLNAALTIVFDLACGPADPTMMQDELVAAAESIGMRFPAPAVPRPQTEQDVFEDWLVSKCPSGDVDEVQRKWEASSELADFLAESAAPAVREPLIDEMDAVASKYAHKLALDLECVLSDYNGKWWDTAMQTIGEYRMAMNRIHEQESPTHMGEPVLPKHGIGGGGNG